jgi:hypothetical protein
MSEETTTPDAPTADAPKLLTGFAVLIDHDGGVYVERNPQALNLALDREATLIEVRRYSSEILMDIQAQSAAEYTMLRLAKASQPKETPAE